MGAANNKKKRILVRVLLILWKIKFFKGFVMHEGILIAASAGAKQQIKMDVLANNMANLNNAGFKSDGLVFREIFPPFKGDTSLEASRNVLLPPNESNRNVAYVAVADFYTDQSQGLFHKTGNALDLAIDGEGFFEVETPQGTRYTRNGNFRLDAENNLVTQDGNYVLDEAQNRIKITRNNRKISIGSNGVVSVGNGLQTVVVGTLRLAKFNDPGALIKEGNGLYKVVNENVAPEIPTKVAVRQGFLERCRWQLSRMKRVSRQ